MDKYQVEQYTCQTRKHILTVQHRKLKNLVKVIATTTREKETKH